MTLNGEQRETVVVRHLVETEREHRAPAGLHPVQSLVLGAVRCTQTKGLSVAAQSRQRLAPARTHVVSTAGLLRDLGQRPSLHHRHTQQRQLHRLLTGRCVGACMRLVVVLVRLMVLVLLLGTQFDGQRQSSNTTAHDHDVVLFFGRCCCVNLGSFHGCCCCCCCIVTAVSFLWQQSCTVAHCVSQLTLDNKELNEWVSE
mmetsp:Transcript_5132/g.12860  ORF Transcript_5132/g.12860 Transcript_5132/m.12860 type:complete len:200 (+) Transcript_5132:112-711(+)